MVSLNSRRMFILSIPQLNRLVETSIVWDENSVSNTVVTDIPSQHRIFLQILNHWQHFRDLKRMFVGSRRAEHLSLCSHQRIVSTVEDSVLRTEMTSFESQEEDVPNRILFFKPMSWLGQIRSHRSDETWSASLCQTLFVTSMGVQIPVIAENPLSACGCKKFQLDDLGDHLCACTTYSRAKRLTSGQFLKLMTFSSQHTKRKRNRWLGAGVSNVGTSSWLWLPHECGGPGVFGVGPPHRPRPFWKEFWP